MKTRLITAFSVAAAMCLPACGFLDVPLESTVSTSNYYKTLQEFDMSLTGVYNNLIDAIDDARYGSYFQGFLVVGRVGTDEMYAAYNNGHEEKAFSDYTYTAENVYVTRPWFMLYRGIYRANVIIDRLTPMDFNDTAEKNRILGESYFLRSFFYFHLVRLYGEVPLAVHETTDIEMLDLTRQPIAKVYEQIESDLKTAIELLPESNANGHAGRYAAKTMLGKAYLQMSGEPLKDPDAAAKSEAVLREVIESGRFDLVTDYFAQFDGRHEYGKEYIWDIEFCMDGTTTYGGQLGTTEGVENPASLYWTMIRTFPSFYDSFDSKDLRRNNVARFRFKYDDAGNLVEENYKDVFKTDEEKARDYFYWAYKFRHPLDPADRGTGWANWANPMNFPVTRYADVLLMYAEAGLRAHGTASAEQVELVNQVRRRGFGRPIKSSAPGVDYDVLTLDRILDERSFELCFEGHRWYDLVRFGKLEEKVKANCHENLGLCESARNIKPKHLFYPVPQDVIDASNGKITQTESWK